MSEAVRLLEAELGAVIAGWCGVCERGLMDDEPRYYVTDTHHKVVYCVCLAAQCRQEVYAGLGIGGFTAVLR